MPLLYKEKNTFITARLGGKKFVFLCVAISMAGRTFTTHFGNLLPRPNEQPEKNCERPSRRTRQKAEPTTLFLCFLRAFSERAQATDFYNFFSGGLVRSRGSVTLLPFQPTFG